MSVRAPMNNVGHENGVAVSTAAVALTEPTSARHMIVYVRNAPCRWRGDGTAPTATTGMYVPADWYLEFMDPDIDYSDFIRRFQMIRDTSAGGDATIDVAYFD